MRRQRKTVAEYNLPASRRLTMSFAQPSNEYTDIANTDKLTYVTILAPSGRQTIYVRANPDAAADRHDSKYGVIVPSSQWVTYSWLKKRATKVTEAIK